MTDRESTTQQLSDLSDTETEEIKEVTPITRRIDLPPKKKKSEAQMATLEVARAARQNKYTERKNLRAENAEVESRKKEAEIRKKIESEIVLKPKSPPPVKQRKDTATKELKKINMEKLIEQKIQDALEDERDRIYNEKEIKRLRKLEEQMLAEKKSKPYSNVKFKTHDGEYF